MASVTFANPRYLFLLFLIPVFIFIHLVSLKMIRSKALRFANFDALARIRGIDFFSKNIVVLLLSLTILVLLVMAASGMILHTTLEASSYSFVLALDTSRSMEANDLQPNRLEAAKDAAKNFIDEVPFGTEVGIVSFSGNALIEQDMTDSRALLRDAIDDIRISEVGGTDLYEAVVTAANLLGSKEAKAIVLLSDGQINVGSVEDSVFYADNNDVVVHTIAIGTEEGGSTSYGLSKLDEGSLESLAYNTEGVFFKVQDNEELLQSFEESIGKTKRRAGIEMARYLVVASVILFTIEYLLINTRYKGVP